VSGLGESPSSSRGERRQTGPGHQPAERGKGSAPVLGWADRLGLGLSGEGAGQVERAKKERKRGRGKKNCFSFLFSEFSNIFSNDF
jgi:hypothetical protein